MTTPISVRVDAAVRAELEQSAKETGRAVSSLAREALTDLARKIKRTRIRKASEAVAAYASADPEARAFFAEWGTPSADV
jgi:predicted transcriptional regulator